VRTHTPHQPGDLRYSPDAMDEYQTLIVVVVLLLCAGAALIVWTKTRATQLRAEAKEERLAQLKL
jgi:hypothetical protein